MFDVASDSANVVTRIVEKGSRIDKDRRGQNGRLRFRMSQAAKTTLLARDRILDYRKYTVAWIAPLPVEADAALGALDRQHEGQFEVTRGDDYDYIGGELNGHYIVVATLPAGQNYGVGAAAALASHVKLRFPNIWFALLVGVAAGLPNLSTTDPRRRRDVRLGDVLVSIPGETGTGIVHYTLGRDLGVEFQTNSRQAETPTIVRAAINRIRLKFKRPYRKGNRLANYLEHFQEAMSAQGEHKFVCPSPAQDQLFESRIDSDGEAKIVPRLPRDDEERTQVWYGNIGSGDTLMRNAQRRDELRDRYDLIGLEMEAAGVMNTLPTGVIRGVCDYGDNYKSKEWQPYAAAVAAVYAKAILCNITPGLTEVNKPSSTAQANEESSINSDMFTSLAFPEMTDRRLNVSRPYEGTCRWLFDVREYQMWMKMPRGLLWIKGKPGSGKSTIMAYLYCVLDEYFRHDVGIHIEFFFNARGITLQHSSVGMLRSLLNQLILKSDYARVVVRKYYDEKCRHFGTKHRTWEWQEEELKALLKEALLEAASHHSVLVFVDALDEAGESTACMIVDFFHTFSNDAISNASMLKICISCRHYPVFTKNYGTEVVVERHNYNDVGTFVNERLASTSLPSQDQDQLAIDLIQRAGGIFQWITLIVPIVEKYIRDGSPLETIKQQVDILPQETGDLYRHILLKVINSRNSQRSLQLFQWICLASTPHCQSKNYDMLWLLTIRCCDARNFVKTDELLKVQVKSLSGGLIEVANNTIQFIHQTVQEYFMEEGLTILTTMSFGLSRKDPFERPNHANGPSQTIVTQQTYGRLYWMCLQYIASEETTIDDVITQYASKYKDHHDTILGRTQLVEELLINSPLLRHAVSNVFVYAEKANNHRAQSLVQQIEGIENIIEVWIKMYNLFVSREYESQLHTGMSSLHIAARASLCDIVTHKLQEGAPVDAQDERGYTALHMAARWGHQEAVEILSDARASAHIEAENGYTALMEAAANSHLNTVKFLLARSDNSESYMPTKAMSLAIACKTGHKQVVWMLIMSGAEVNTSARRFGAPLEVASFKGHVDIVRLLLANGADVNFQSGQWGSALHAASVCGHFDILKLLLDNPANVNTLAGGYGSALQAASISAQPKIARLLIDHGADIDTICGRYGSALQAASYRGGTALVKLLLAEGADVDLQGGVFGSALHAASYMGHLDVVRVLLKNGAHVNSTFENDSSALDLASENPSLNVVRLLLKKGANVNLIGGVYGTALQRASFHGHLELVYLLLRNGADVNLEAGQYGSALQAASANGHLKVVQTLIEHGANINHQGGELGSALQAASIHDHRAVVLTLLEKGADVNQRGGKYGSPCEAALHKGHRYLALLLLEKGAHPSK